MHVLRLFLMIALVIAGTATAQPRRAAQSAKGLDTRQITVGGKDRNYYVFDPSPDGTTFRPLILVMHGGGGQPLALRRHGFEGVARREGFVVVYPEGYNNAWADGRTGDVPEQRAADVDDVAFLSGMIDAMVADDRIDRARVYATGASNGGFMSLQLACRGLVSGAAPQIAQMAEGIAEDCNPKRALPVFFINGDADRLVPYDGGAIVPYRPEDRGRALSVADSLAQWRRINGCTDDKTGWRFEPIDADDVPVDAVRWSDCRDGVAVQHFRAIGGGHQWHGPPQAGSSNGLTQRQRLRAERSGPAARSFFAAEEIWRFFEAYGGA